MGAALDIDVLGNQCMNLFQVNHRLFTDPAWRSSTDVSPAAIQDEFGRFRIWGRNIGAFQPKTFRSSLEHRLRDSSRTRQQVLNILQDLHESLDESIF